MKSPALAPAIVARAVELALAEDIGSGDLTSRAVVPEETRLRAALTAREPLTLAGMPVVREVYRQLGDPEALDDAIQEGSRIQSGEVAGYIDTSARLALTGERTALNFLQRLSGIATRTRTFVDAVAGTGASILDTRKTVPGLRALDKYAVAMGGGINHRFGLFDAILIKDNHIAAAGGVHAALRAARSASPNGVRIQIEVDTLDQFDQALAAGAEFVLLDNMTPAAVQTAVHRAEAHVRLEVSGLVNLGNVRAYAETGVHDISIGSLTHSARAVDIGLDATELA
ncbi:MAG: carboxylating nicotinate-nucleotide diphosphorylase [Chloroflexota bacterium]|nr:carboxylating nicotinate-nucleotide diphosphorylase [Chloroflexota bacterium]